MPKWLDNQRKYGNIIKNKRIELGESLKTFAKRFDISSATIYLLEQGGWRPRKDILDFCRKPFEKKKEKSDLRITTFEYLLKIALEEDRPVQYNIFTNKMKIYPVGTKLPEFEEGWLTRAELQ